MSKTGIIFGSIACGVLIVLLGVQIYTFHGREAQVSDDMKALQEKYEKAKQDHASLEEELQYLAQPNNLEKEVRSRFNYVKPGEKMIIIVPPHTTSSTP